MTYYWRVRAIDKAGNISEWSDVWQFHLIASITTVEPVETPVPDSDPVQTGDPPAQWVVPTPAPPPGKDVAEPTPTPVPGGEKPGPGQEPPLMR